MCVCVIFNFRTSRTMFSQKGGVCNGFEFVNNTSSSTTCFKYCVSLDFRPSVMEFPARQLALYTNRSGWLELAEAGENRFNRVVVYMV